MLRRLTSRYTTWLLCAWCAVIAGWVLLDRRNVPVCLFGWLRCGTEGSPDSLWIEPRHGRQILALGIAGVLVLAVLAWFEGRRPKRAGELVPRRPRARSLALIGLAATLAAAHLLLLSPVEDKLLCAQTVRMNSAMAYPLNCDSPAFLDLAHHPGKILEADNGRQSRPGYVYLGAAATAVLGPITSVTHLDQAYGTTDSAYLPLVLINLLVVAATLAVFLWLLLRVGVSWLIAGSLAAILAINDVTKAYYWSPHQAMFTLLVPVLTIAVAQWLLRRDPGPRGIALLGLGLGLGMLVYGSFVIPIAVCGLLLAHSLLRRRAKAVGWTSITRRVLVPVLAGPQGTGAEPEPAGPDAAAGPSPATGPDEPAAGAPRLRALVRLALLCGLAVAPTLVWILVCKAVAGSYFNNETVVYHEFVWLPQAIGAGGDALRSGLSAAAVNTTLELFQVAWLPFGLLAASVVAATVAGVRLGAPRDTEAGATVIATVLTGLVTVVFLYAMGFWAYRITYTIIPTVLVALGWTAARLSTHSRFARWAVGLVVAGAAGSWVGFQLLSHGPYS